MWAGDDSPFIGSHYRLQRPINSPQSVSRPHPPILIGGMGERKTLRLVAQYGDACNLFDIPDGGKTITHKLSVLARHCETLNRPYEEIEKTLSTRLLPDESADQLAQRCAGLSALGIEHAIMITNGPWTEDAVATLAAAVPQLRQL
jgi:alkanesulfonate monooxygenase SsuD/methylene tetrahydromethanopterin reductase-like flavin-dependent oxidoreductase (luciferase family)